MFCCWAAKSLVTTGRECLRPYVRIVLGTLLYLPPVAFYGLKLQTEVALSTIKSEYITISQATQDLLPM